MDRRRVLTALALILCASTAAATQGGPVYTAVPSYPVAGGACSGSRVQMQADTGKTWCCVSSKWEQCSAATPGSATTFTSAATSGNAAFVSSTGTKACLDGVSCTTYLSWDGTGLFLSSPNGNALVSSSALLHVPFANPGCYASGSTAGGTSALTITRASTKACSGVGTCQNNEICVEASGQLTASEQISVASPVKVGQPFCVIGEFQPDASRAWTSEQEVIWALGVGGNANSVWLTANVASNLAFNVRDASNTKTVAYSHVFAAGSRHELAACLDATGAMTFYVDGAVATGSPSGTGTGILAAAPATMAIATGGTAALYWKGWTKDLRICAGAVPYTCGVQSSNALIAALGDSITSGYGVATPYPTVLKDTYLGVPWTITNAGVPSETTAQMLTRWNSTVKSSGAGTLVLLGGINDVRTDVAAAAAFANLQTMYDEARAAGWRVVPVTVLPWKGYIDYTAGREDQRVALNTLIKNYCTSNGITCIDADADFDDGTQTMKLAYRQADMLHPNQTGANRLAQLIRAAFP